MSWLRAFLLFVLTLGAALPACAHAHGGPIAPVAHHHAVTRPGTPQPAPPAPFDHHAVACIGCAAQWPDADSPAPATMIGSIAPISPEPSALSGRSPSASLPPPRLA